MTRDFWHGFEKRAISLIGVKSGLRSGKRNYSSFGQVTRSQPKSGIVEAPRSTPPPLPTPAKIQTKFNQAAKPAGKMPAMPQVPKPPKQVSKGVAATFL